MYSKISQQNGAEQSTYMYNKWKLKMVNTMPMPMPFDFLTKILNFIFLSYVEKPCFIYSLLRSSSLWLLDLLMAIYFFHSVFFHFDFNFCLFDVSLLLVRYIISPLWLLYLIRNAPMGNGLKLTQPVQCSSFACLFCFLE